MVRLNNKNWMSTLIGSCMIRYQCITKINYHMPDLCRINPVTLKVLLIKSIGLSVPKTVVSQVVDHSLKEQAECHWP